MFLAPIGYLNAPRPMGSSLMHDPERAPLVRRAFEDYATGSYTKRTTPETGRAWGLTNRRRKLLTSQAIGVFLQTGSMRALWMSPSPAFAENAATSRP